MIPGFGGEFGFPDVEVCARHGFGGGVGGEAYEARVDVEVGEEAEGEGEGDGVEGVVWSGGRGGRHCLCCVGWFGLGR